MKPGDPSIRQLEDRIARRRHRLLVDDELKPGTVMRQVMMAFLHNDLHMLDALRRAEGVTARGGDS